MSALLDLRLSLLRALQPVCEGGVHEVGCRWSRRHDQPLAGTAGASLRSGRHHAGPLKAVGGLDAADSVSRLCVPARRRRGVKAARLRKRALDVRNTLPACERDRATCPGPRRDGGGTSVARCAGGASRRRAIGQIFDINVIHSVVRGRRKASEPTSAPSGSQVLPGTHFSAPNSPTNPTNGWIAAEATPNLWPHRFVSSSPSVAESMSAAARAAASEYKCSRPKCPVGAQIRPNGRAPPRDTPPIADRKTYQAF